jgi:hypothetical protein
MWSSIVSFLNISTYHGTQIVAAVHLIHIFIIHAHSLLANMSLSNVLLGLLWWIATSTTRTSHGFPLQHIGGGGGGGVALATQQGIIGLGTYAALLVALDRPRGGVAKGIDAMVQVRDSTVAGKGLFVTQAMTSGTVLGRYPGVCTPLEPHLDKLRAHPQCEVYIWRFSDNRYVLDPTNRMGRLDEVSYGGTFRTAAWFEQVPLLRYLAKDTKLCRINEPPLGKTTNVRMEENLADRTVTLSLIRNVYAGEELFADYGTSYDRSRYGPRQQPHH